MSDLRSYLYRIFVLTGQDKYRVFVIILYFSIASLLDLIGIGLIAIYATFIVNPDIILKSEYLNNFDITLINQNLETLTIYIGLLLTAVFLVKTSLSIFIYSEVIKFDYLRQRKLRLKIINYYQSLSFENYLNKNSSEASATASIYIQTYGQVINSLLLFIGNMIVTFLILLLLVITNGPILILMLLIMGLAVYIYKKLFIDKLNIYGEQVNRGYKQILQGLSEYFEGFKELKILGKHEYFEEKIKKGTNLIADNDIKQSIITAMPRFLLESLLIIFIVSIVIINILLNKNTEELVPIISLFAAAGIRLAPMLNQISGFLATFRRGHDAINKIYNTLFDEVFVPKKTQKKARTRLEKLQIKNLSYRYPNTQKDIFNGINLTINAGDSIGIIGGSGKGKTTLVDIILGLLDPYEGKIIYNDSDLKESMFDWRSQIAYLPQDVFLVNDTIANNIALGVNINKINKNDLENAIVSSQLKEFIDELPDRENTIVGERGINLSGGQKQRLALARSFYFKKDILIFDEATSSLDYETEKQIINQIQLLKKIRTIIIISHRQETIKFVDKVYNITDGQVSNINQV